MSGEKNKSPKMDRAKYAEIKKTIYKRELSNHSRLFLFNTGDDWYKMSGNSLLIFVYEIAPKIPLKPNILPDNDYTDTIFEEGLVSFHGIDSLKKRLEKVKVLKEVHKTDDVVAFDLNFEVSDKRLIELKEILKEDQERAVAILKPEVILVPTAYTKMRHVMKRTFEVTRKMPVTSRDVCGERMMFYAKEIVNTYLLMNKEIISEQKAWPEMLKMAEKLQIEMAIAVELKVLDQNSAVSIGGDLINLKHILKREIKKRDANAKKTGR